MNVPSNMRHSNSGTVLAFDTSTATLAVSIVRDGTELGAVQSHAERNHSVLIVPEIKRLMAACDVDRAGLDAIAVGRGPGSYTGVRIAVTVGKTLAWVWGKPLLGVSSLEALAWQAWERAQGGDVPYSSMHGPVWIVPVLDARRGQVYTARFAVDRDGGWQRLDADGIRLAEEWAADIRREAAGAGGASVILFTGDIASHTAHFNASSGGEGVTTLTADGEMAATAIGRLAAVRWQQGAKDDVHAFVPNYTQLAEAEAKRLAAAQGD